MDIDSIENHIRTVTNQHTALERQLEHLLAQKSWDEFQVERLKKQKLLLKDELTVLYRQRHELAEEIHWE